MTPEAKDGSHTGFSSIKDNVLDERISLEVKTIL